jgi:hypothetical protein
MNTTGTKIAPNVAPVIMRGSIEVTRRPNRFLDAADGSDIRCPER